MILGIETTVCRNSIGFKPLAKTVCENLIGFKPLAKTVCKKTIGGAHVAQTVCKESLVLTARAQGHAKNVWFSAQRHARDARVMAVARATVFIEQNERCDLLPLFAALKSARSGDD